MQKVTPEITTVSTSILIYTLQKYSLFMNYVMLRSMDDYNLKNNYYR
jgi:hypothetical protein